MLVSSQRLVGKKRQLVVDYVLGLTRKFCSLQTSFSKDASRHQFPLPIKHETISGDARQVPLNERFKHPVEKDVAFSANKRELEQRTRKIRRNESFGLALKAAVNTFDIVSTSVKTPKLLYIWTNEGFRWLLDTTQQTVTGIRELNSNVKVSFQLTFRSFFGYTISRRERLKISQTKTDFLKAVPLSFMVITPGMIVFVPWVLKRFPNMLPSTFKSQDQQKLKRRRHKKLRLELAPVVQQIVENSFETALIRKNMTGNQKNAYTKERIAFRIFCLKARIGEAIPPNVLAHLSKLSRKLQIDNLSRNELVVFCRYMTQSTLGDDEYLKYQIYHKLNSLKEDDALIHWEGIDTLSSTELRQACQDRGMCTTGLSKIQLQQQLKIWLSLSMNKSISPMLLMLFSANQLQQLMTSPE